MITEMAANSPSCEWRSSLCRGIGKDEPDCFTGPNQINSIGIFAFLPRVILRNRIRLDV